MTIKNQPNVGSSGVDQCLPKLSNLQQQGHTHHRSIDE